MPRPRRTGQLPTPSVQNTRVTSYEMGLARGLDMQPGICIVDFYIYLMCRHWSQ